MYADGTAISALGVFVMAVDDIENAGNDFGNAARNVRDGVSGQWNNEDSALNRSVDGVQDQWQREDSWFNRAWDWTTDGISKHFKTQSDNPNGPGEYQAAQVLTALGLSLYASRFISHNVTGDMKGFFGLALSVAIGVTTTAVLGKTGAAQGLTEFGRNVFGGDDGPDRIQARGAELLAGDDYDYDDLEAG